MKYALKEAEKAFDADEIPVGCVIVHKNRIIAKSFNQTETLTDPTAHAEMLALTSAFAFFGKKQLDGCSLYVTLEPCSMCAGAIVLSKPDAIYFGAYDPKSGACGSVLNITNNKALNHKCSTYGGILDTECGNLLKAYFEIKRKGGSRLKGFSAN